MATRNSSFATGIAIWFVTACATCANGSEAATHADTEDRTAVEKRASDAAVLARFLLRPDEPTNSFRARRRLEITGKLGKSAWMEVAVDVDPESGFRYDVLAAGGSEMLQRKILHKVLRAEQAVYAAGENPKAALTADNYDFLPGGYDQEGFVRLEAKAKRKEIGLLNGQFLVTPDDADLVEVSGTMARAPSFWIPCVEMRKRYARVQGHRMNVRVDSVSHVRLLGEVRFTMTSEYESIEGDAVLTASGPSGARP